MRVAAKPLLDLLLKAKAKALHDGTPRPVFAPDKRIIAFVTVSRVRDRDLERLDPYGREVRTRVPFVHLTRLGRERVECPWNARDEFR